MTVPFGEATRTWFARSFAAPTPVQERGWASIASGRHTLMLAPTGSGKTLAAFLWCLDRLAHAPADAAPTRAPTRVVYVSPIKALAYDVERNLRAPLAGLQALGAGGQITVDVRTGDTSPKERERQRKHPGQILITTPESLYLLLAGQSRERLRSGRYDHRRRDPRARADQARHPPRADARAARAPGHELRQPRTAADRPVGDPTPTYRGR